MIVTLTQAQFTATPIRLTQARVDVTITTTFTVATETIPSADFSNADNSQYSQIIF